MQLRAGTAQALFPPGPVFLEQFGPPPPAELAPQERAAVATATPRRLAEFAATRELARRALVALGLGPAALPKGADGSPSWPEGVVGTLTHCAGYRAVALARRSTALALGLDAEPEAPLPPRLVGRIATPREREALAKLGGSDPYERLLFCAKEAAFKANAALGGEVAGLLELEVVLEGGLRAGSFSILPVCGVDRRLVGACGRWLIADGILRAAVTVLA